MQMLPLRSVLRAAQASVPGRRVKAASFATRALSTKALVYDAPGEPVEVLRYADLPLAPPKPDEVAVKFLQAPINPSDINTVQGKYPLMPKLPNGVPGHEGVGEVLEVGSQVSGLRPGDWVVPLTPALGTWRQQGVFSASDLHRVPNDIPVEAAATLCINPPSALGMLEAYVDLKPGDVVVQNGATSAVGHLVIQIAKAKGVKTVNIIRDRPNWDETVAELKALGADVVTTEEKAKDALKASGLKAPLLGLNCVGGTAALAATKLLGQGGTLVTYGGMSMQPVTVPTAMLIFKDISFRGFWLSGRFAREQGPRGRAAMLDRLVDMIKQGQIAPVKSKVFSLEQYREALQEVNKPYKNLKVMLKM